MGETLAKCVLLVQLTTLFGGMISCGIAMGLDDPDSRFFKYGWPTAAISLALFICELLGVLWWKLLIA